jgi:hypothetical protein
VSSVEAVHEAAHATIARLLGVPVRRVTRDGTLCWVEPGSIEAHQKQAIVCLAGPRAERRFVRAQNGQRMTTDERYELWATCWRKDRRHADEHLAASNVDEDTARKTTSRLVLEHWDVILRVAAALDERGELTGAEIDALLHARKPAA